MERGSVLRRVRGLASSIRTRFVFIAVAITLLGFGIIAVFAQEWIAQTFEENHQERVSSLLQHIRHELHETSLKEAAPHQEALRVLETHRKQENIRELGIYDIQGRKAFARSPGSRDRRVEEVLRSGQQLHFHEKINEQEVGTYFLPIRNEADCQRCHWGQGPFLGVFLASLSLNKMAAQMSGQMKKFYILFAVMGTVVCISTILAVNHLFLRPLRQLRRGTESVERGDFQYRIPGDGRDEIGGLIRNFNQMAQNLENFFDELKDKNQQLIEQFKLVSLSQNDWKATFDSIADPVAVMDQDCKITRSNRAFQETFLDFSSDAGNGRKLKCPEIFGCCPLSDFPCHTKVNPKDDRFKNIQVHHCGTGRLFEISLFPYSPEEDFRGSVFIAKDITEKRESEMRLIMSERLAALGQMVSGLAHEINNPLATIGMCAQGLLAKMEKGQFTPAYFANYLNIIMEEIQQCRRITHSMLAFVRKPVHEEKGVDITGLLDRIVEMMSVQGRMTHVEVIRNHEEGMPPFNGQEGPLRQVFLSVIVNALDAMNDQGTLTLEAKASCEGVTIQISDTGRGIPPAHIPKIFDPFFTTKPAGKGTGLGLSIAKKILTDSNGHIEVFSREGEGTTFTITLRDLSPSFHRSSPETNFQDPTPKEKLAG